MRGLITTIQQTSGAVGVATFGTAHFGLVLQPRPGIAMRSFAIVVLAFALTALLATVAAHRSSSTRDATWSEVEALENPENPDGSD